MREIICTICPRGCRLHIDGAGDAVTGNHCARGKAYGRNEFLHPVRTVTSTIAIQGASVPRLPVKTDRPIPKEQVLACMDLIHAVVVQAPVTAGEVLLKNILNCGADLIAGRTLEREELYEGSVSQMFLKGVMQ